MPTIYIDEDVFSYLQRHATPLVDNPNTTLRRLFGLTEAEQPSPSAEEGFRLRRGASGLGDSDRYLRGMVATISHGGSVYRRSGARSPRGADLNQLQTWIAELVGPRHGGNAQLIQKLRAGSRQETIGDVTVVVQPQTNSEQATDAIPKGRHMSIPDPTYPDPEQPLAVRCPSCDSIVAGSRSGSEDFRYILKAIKAHEDDVHGPYNPALIQELSGLVEEINASKRVDGRVGRYMVSLF
jgi:hypothetical protein